MHLGPTPVVGLIGPLALGHGSRLLVTSGLHIPAMSGDIRGTCPPSVAFPLVTGAAPDKPVAAESPTFGRPLEGTDRACAGQTAHTAGRRLQLWILLRYRLALFPKPVSFWQNTNENNPTYGVYRPQKN